MKLILRFVAFILATLQTILAYAQTGSNGKNITHQLQVWSSVNSTVRINEHWGMMADFHARRTDFIRYPSFYFGRLGAIYWINTSSSFAAGIGEMSIAPPPETYTTWAREPRLFEQFQYKFTWGKTTALHRLRIEQRWREIIDPVADISTGNYSFNNRVRYLLSFTIPVSEKPEVPKLILSNELLVVTSKPNIVSYNFFEQNRFFIGVMQQINSRWSFDFGYMNVFQQTVDDKLFMNHTIRLFFYYKYDKYKSKMDAVSGEE